MWLNEYHADFLARDRLAEARERAARRDIVERVRRRSLRRLFGAGLIRLGRRLAGATARRPARARA
jgi:hypothetical protein